jgi:RNA polymerase sigma-70 factor (ECF subfamily)
MPNEQDGAKISQAYQEHRPYLVDLAFRMLGDIGAAEDVVQDAFARLMRTGAGEIDDERGWLIVVTSRLCLDQIRSARSRRERAHDPGEMEVAAPAAQLALADPADRVTFDDSVRLALLVVLQRLTPAERVVFVLHDIFQMPFDTVAQTVGRTSPACRQLATRARQKISASDGGDRFDITCAEHRLVTEKFIAASGKGDLSGLLEVLAPDAWGDVDYGPASARPHVVVTGAERVARHLLHFWGPGATLVSHPVGRQPAVLGFFGRELAGVLVFTLHNDVIEVVHVIADPAKLSFLSFQLATPA